ncbi:glycosyltransferase family 2 protein [Baekduia sp. Peel2402]|uniref:glycosyltransferase family 2 protein n=1 Tax=Baekduia sp. Peel2402 TaxID=3458296 RepID=UPI00403EA8E5
MPRVSVVITSYNYGRHLGQAVESVLAQTLTDLEVLVVDDGSTDDTLEVARRYEAADPRVTVIAQENSGQPAIPRNRATERAVGEYVLCLDADDHLAPDVLALCVAELDADPAAGMAYPTTQMVGAREQRLSIVEWGVERLALCNFLPCPTLFRREAWVAAKGYNLNVRGYEDWDLWLGIAEAGWTGRPAREAIYFYRQHDDGGLCEQARPHDQRLKAQVVVNRSGVFTDLQLEWAHGVLAGHASALAIDGAQPGHVPQFAEEPVPLGAASVSADPAVRAAWLRSGSDDVVSPFGGGPLADLLGLAQRLDYSEVRDERGAVVARRRAKDPVLFPVPALRADASDAERATALAAAAEQLLVAAALRAPTLDPRRTAGFLGLREDALGPILQGAVAVVESGAADVSAADAPVIGAVARLVRAERTVAGDRAGADRAANVARAAARAGLEGARTVTVLAYGDELVADPTLLSSYGDAFGAQDDVTLVIATDDPATLSGAVVAAGLDSDASPDMLAVTAAPAIVDAVFSRRAVGAAPRFDDTTVPALRALVAAAA